MFADRMLQQVGASWPVAEKKMDRWRPHFMPLSRLLCWAGRSFYDECVSVDGAIEFSVEFLGGPPIGSFSPGALADRLSRAARELGEDADRSPIKAISEIPESTRAALELKMPDEYRAKLERPRVLFYSNDEGW